MKTSNLLIIAMILLLFISSAATNLALKKEFDKIDKTDPTYGFTKHNVASFSHIKMSGRGFGLTEIHQGSNPQLRTIIKEDALTWKVANDTLFVTFKPEWNAVGFADLYGKPSIYIYTPKLRGITSDQIVSRIRDVTADSLYIRQAGRGMLITESHIGKLHVEMSKSGFLKFGNKNAFTDASLSVADSSALEVDENAFKNLQLHIDSTAQIKIPGNMIKVIQNDLN